MKKFLFILLGILITLVCVAYINNISDSNANELITSDDGSNLNESEKVIEDESNWEIRYYVDEFNEPTSEKYITNIKPIIGTFSNTATTDSKLSVHILIDKDDAVFTMWEYGKLRVKATSLKEYNVTMRTPKGEDLWMVGKMYSDRILFEAPNEFRNYRNEILTALLSDGTVSFHLSESTSSYLFSVETSGFADVYRSVNWNK